MPDSSSQRGAVAPLAPGKQLQAAQDAAMALLAGRAAEREFWPLCGLFATAVHEASHALAGHLTGSPVSRASIAAPDSVTAGYVLHGAKDYESTIRIPARSFASSDQRQALLMLHLGEPGAGWRRYRARMKEAKFGATDFVRRHHWEIGVLADRLLKAGTLEAAEIRETIESAMSDPRAGLPAEQLPGIARLESEVVTCLAGNAAARRCLRSSTPGWKIMQSLEAVRAFHESGHALGRWCEGKHVWRLSIIPNESVRMGKTGFSGGHCVAGDTPEPPAPIERPKRMETDFRQAARVCLALALRERPYDWRSALRIAHRLRSRARELVEAHWPLIARLAAELVERRELDGTEIEAILKPKSREM